MDINQGVFDKLLLRLEPDYSNFEKRYRQLRLKLVKFFAWRRCEDPESLADETISRTVKNIIEGEEIRTSKPYSYIYAIALNVFREYLREKSKREATFVSFPTDPSSILENLYDCRKQCFQKLPAEKVRILQCYYSSGESKEKMAQSQGVTLNALRLQIHRIKNDLKACYQDCVKQLKS